MKRVLITGMSGTGKSTLIRELAARGYTAIDTDSDEWSAWANVAGDFDQLGSPAEPDWVWREDRIQSLLATDETPARRQHCDGHARRRFVPAERARHGRRGLPSEHSGGCLTITKYSDNNINGQQDSGEPVMSGWTFEVRNYSTGELRRVSTATSGSAVVADLSLANTRSRRSAATRRANSRGGGRSSTEPAPRGRLSEARLALPTSQSAPRSRASRSGTAVRNSRLHRRETRAAFPRLDLTRSPSLSRL